MEITDNISNLKTNNLEIIILKEVDFILYYLEEYIPEFIIFDSSEKINEVSLFLKNNPDTKIFIPEEKDYFKEYSNRITVGDFKDIGSLEKIIGIINSLEENENTVSKAKSFRVSESLKVINQQVLTFISTKGGSGKTTIALNIAAIASEELKLKTAYMDLNFSDGYSDIASYLKIYSVPNMSYYLSNYKDGKSALDSSISFSSKNGLDIYISPMSSIYINNLNMDIFNSLFYLMRSNYSLIIIDFPPNFFLINDFFKSILDFTSCFLSVSYPIELCAKKTYAVKQIMGENHLVLNILNNPFMPMKFSKTQYEAISGSKVISEIPFIPQKLQRRLKIDYLNTDIIDLKGYLRSVFEDYLMT